MELRNHMEIVVERKLKELMKKDPSICDCDHCYLDTMALALNTLKPQYYVTDEGELYTKASDLTLQFEADVVRALVQALAVVKEHPRHD